MSLGEGKGKGEEEGGGRLDRWVMDRSSRNQETSTKKKLKKTHSFKLQLRTYRGRQPQPNYPTKPLKRSDIPALPYDIPSSSVHHTYYTIKTIIFPFPLSLPFPCSFPPTFLPLFFFFFSLSHSLFFTPFFSLTSFAAPPSPPGSSKKNINEKKGAVRCGAVLGVG